MINLKKNKLWIIFIFLILIGIAIYFFTNNKNTDNNSNNVYTANKTSTEGNDNNTESEKNKIEISQGETTNNTQKKEEQISTFSTKIYNKESSRQNNVTITCSTLNQTIVPNGSTFSFCNTVGQATTQKGYQKADIFDKNGNKKKGLGGGNCQVSSTLYNAALNTPGLKITERHEHSNKVPYIQTGKDAAVAYGSYDLKFVNNTGFDIKIKAENTADNVIITLYKLT